MIMKKINQNIILLFALLIILVSCEDVVNVNINEEDIDLISVEAYINTKATDNIYVKVERTLPVTESNQNPAINNAIIEITDNADSPNTVLLKEEGESGIYSLTENTTYKAIPGRTYNLTITTHEGVVIKGEEFLQEVEQLDSMKINLSARGNFEFLAVFINSQETPGVGHYYKWDIYKNGNLMYKSDQLSFVSDELVDGNYVADFEIFTDFASPDEPENVEFQIGDTVYVEQLSISKNAYFYYTGMVNQAFTGTPFSVPPANLVGNLTSNDGNRILGMFSARDISIGNTVIIDSTNYTPINQGSFN